MHKLKPIRLQLPVVAKPEIVSVAIPTAVAAGAPTRFFGIEAAIRNAASALQGDPSEDALLWIADEISRLACDLDIATWPAVRS